MCRIIGPVFEYVIAFFSGWENGEGIVCPLTDRIISLLTTDDHGQNSTNPGYGVIE
jgi:hypothetical protein